MTNLFSHLLPAFPIFLIQTIFDRNNRILVNERFPMCNQLIRSKFFAGFWLLIVTNSFFRFPFGRSCIHSNHKIFSQFKSGSLNSLQNFLNSFFIRSKFVWCKSTFITNRCYISHIFNQRFQLMENLCTPAERFFKRWCANRHNHKFLRING